MRIGLNGGGDFNRVSDVLEHARVGAADGFRSYWLSQIFGVDALTTFAIVGTAVPDIELGTAIVPTYPRHPTALALQAMTVQQAIGGRLVLGVGPSHKPIVEQMWGASYAHPLRHTREYVAALRPLLRGEPANVAGEHLVARGALTVAAPPVPLLVAGLGPRMLECAGGDADGTVTWMCGVETVAHHIVPRVRAAAARAGRPAPRIVVGLPVCVTDDAERARRYAAEKLKRYAELASYRAMLDREGAQGPEDICLIGDEGRVRESIAALAHAGATDLRATELEPTPEDRARTRKLLKALL